MRKEFNCIAIGRACFRSGEIQILDSTGNVQLVIPFDDANRKLWCLDFTATCRTLTQLEMSQKRL